MTLFISYFFQGVKITCAMENSSQLKYHQMEIMYGSFWYFCYSDFSWRLILLFSSGNQYIDIDLNF